MQSNFPKVIPCAIYVPGRRVLQLVINYKNTSDALAKIVSKIAEHNINILSGFIIAEPSKDVGVLTFFLDFTDSNLDSKEVVEELKALDIVLDARVIVRKFGEIAVDGTTYTTIFLGERVVMLSVDGIGAMFDWLDQTFQTGGHAILYQMGEQAGRTNIKELRETYGLRGRDLIEAFLALRTAAGWFDYEIVEYDEEALKFVIRLHGNFECTPFVNKRDRPMGHLMRGLLAGAFGESYGREFSIREVKCIAKGDDYCEFVITSVTRKENEEEGGEGL